VNAPGGAVLQKFLIEAGVLPEVFAEIKEDADFPLSR
jgi:hypothetical protein